MDMTTNKSPKDVAAGDYVMFMSMREGGRPAIWPGRVISRKGRTLVAWFPELNRPGGKFKPTTRNNYQVFTWRASRAVWGREGDNLPRMIDSVLWFPDAQMAESCYLPRDREMNRWEVMAKLPKNLR